MHAIEYKTFSATRTTADIEKRINEYVCRESDCPCGLYSHIRWLDKTFASEEEAMEYIRKADKGDYDNLAVRYIIASDDSGDKKLAALKAKSIKAFEKREEYEKKHSIANLKAEYIGCPSCGSRLKRELLGGECCPLCQTDLRSKTTLDTLERYTANIASIEKEIAKAVSERNAKKAKKAKASEMFWLVKIEYHT